MRRAKAIVDWVLGWVLVVLMAAAVVNVLWQVFTRFVLANPSSFTEELARYLLIWIGVLGAGYAVGRRAHLALELLPETLDGRGERWLAIGIQGVILVFALAVLVVGGARLVYIQLQLGQTSAAMGVPIGLVYLVLPLSGAVMAFYNCAHVAEEWYRLTGDTAEEPTSDA
jgi:TRAP-type C4-dicarboxylate transport system permease small subunit